MVVVPAGRVALTDRRSSATWIVDVAAFELGVHPVARDGVPVTDVSWFDAAVHCNELSAAEGLDPAYVIDLDAEHVAWDEAAGGYRLPTEAEWEHACRAGTTGARYGDLDDIAWYRDNSGDAIHAVGGKQSNAWGLHDMLGNVWEWCWDIYDAEVYGAYRVLRGGGWLDEQWSCRASVRRRAHPTFRIDDVGFRVARSLSLPESN